MKLTNLFVVLALFPSLIACSGPLDPLPFAATAIAASGPIAVYRERARRD